MPIRLDNEVHDQAKQSDGAEPPLQAFFALLITHT